jgi:hypothetical protein
MTAEQVFFAITISAILVFLGSGFVFANKVLSGITKTIFLFMVVVQAGLAALYLFSITITGPSFWKWFFHIHAELNAGAMYGATQLMAVCLLAMLNSVVVPGRVWQRVFWLILAAIFLFLSLDEYFVIHEDVIGLDKFRIPYIIFGVSLAIFCALAWWFGFRRETALLSALLSGLGLIGFGGLLYEPFVLWPRICPLVGSVCPGYYVYGETMETFGATLVLTGFLSYAQRRLDRLQMEKVAKALLLVGGIWFSYLAANTWLLPAIEARTLAAPLSIEYENGLVKLIGYTVSPSVIRGSSSIRVTLYWLASQTLERDYNISVHLLSQPDMSSVAQDDWISSAELNVYPSVDWLPGIPVRTVFSVELPKDLATSRSYLLIARLWSGNDSAISVTDADRPLLTSDTVILQGLPALSTAPPPSPASASQYQFGSGLILYGYNLPQRIAPGQSLTVGFWWRKNSAFNAAPSQFLHLVASDRSPLVFDQPPFRGTFPIPDWPIGVDIMDQWVVSLPSEAWPGNYDVYSGLYEWPSLLRLSVTDANGQPMPNNEVRLGMVELRSGSQP